MEINELKQLIANTKDGYHKQDLIRQLKRLYRKKRLENGQTSKQFGELAKKQRVC